MSRHALRYVDLHPTPCHTSKNALWRILVTLAGTVAIVAPMLALMLAYFDVL